MSVITLLFPLGWQALSLCFLIGIAAATMFMSEKQIEVSETQLRVAFDGDAVLFSDESERIFKAHGLDKFFEHERENENRLLDHVSIVIHLNGLYFKYDTEQIQNTCLKEQLSQKWKFAHVLILRPSKMEMSSEQICIIFKLHNLLTNRSSAVNGCRQNESPNFDLCIFFSWFRLENFFTGEYVIIFLPEATIND